MEHAKPAVRWCIGAARHGQVSVLLWLERGGHFQTCEEVLIEMERAAASRNHVCILEFLDARSALRRTDDLRIRAIREGHMEALDFLMWYTFIDIQALMVAAVKRGDMRIIKYMHRELDKGVNGDFECLVKAWPYGVTPLHIAAGGRRHIQVLQWLHEMTGMDLDTRDKEQRSPLHHALLTGADRSVSWLIERRANIEATDGCGTTPLMYAAANDACAGMRMLLRARAKIEATDDRGWSALMHAAEDNHEVCIQQLIDAGAKVNRKSVDGFTALMLVCENGQFNRALLSAPADIDERNTTTGSTALMLAAAYGHASCTLALLDQGASHSIQNFKGDTALSYVSVEEEVEDHLICTVLVLCVCCLQERKEFGEELIFGDVASCRRRRPPNAKARVTMRVARLMKSVCTQIRGDYYHRCFQSKIWAGGYCDWNNSEE